MDQNKKIAVVISRFNQAIYYRLKQGTLEELQQAGVKNVEWVEVPGVVEIPLTAQWLFQNNIQVVVALGAVIRGETSHYQACCRLVEQGCMQVQLKMNRPIIFGVLMTDNFQQAMDRTGGSKGHIARSSVQTGLQMLSLGQQLQK